MVLLLSLFSVFAGQISFVGRDKTDRRWKRYNAHERHYKTWKVSKNVFYAGNVIGLAVTTLPTSEDCTSTEVCANNGVDYRVLPFDSVGDPLTIVQYFDRPR